MFYNGMYEDNGLGALPQVASTVGQVAGSTGAIVGGLSSAGLIGSGALLGSVVPIVGTIVGALAGIIATILGQHSQKVAVENKVSGQWAATGPQTVNSIVGAWQSGQATSDQASAGLDAVYQQFLVNNAQITKMGGTFGKFPDPNAPRPSSNCNWACGTSWDLYSEIQGLKAQMGTGTSPLVPTSAGGLDLTSLTSSPLLLLGGAALVLFLLKK